MFTVRLVCVTIKSCEMVLLANLAAFLMILFIAPLSSRSNNTLQDKIVEGRGCETILVLPVEVTVTLALGLCQTSDCDG